MPIVVSESSQGKVLGHGVRPIVGAELLARGNFTRESEMQVLAEKTVHYQLQLHTREPLTRDEVNREPVDWETRQRAIREVQEPYDRLLMEIRRFTRTQGRTPFLCSVAK